MPRLLLHIPHSSTVVPDDVRTDIELSDADLAAELLAMTDHYTDELFGTPLTSTRIVFPVSRLVVDPERFVDDGAEPMASRGMGVIYIRTSTGSVLRRAPSATVRAHLLRRFYEPHHARLAGAVDGSLRDHGRCLIIDCHSFPSVGRPYELDQAVPRPDICIGTDRVHTPERLADLAIQLFRDGGYTVERNRPYSGSIVPHPHFGSNPAVSSIMIELNRALYMDEITGVRAGRFDELAAFVSRVLDQLASQSA